MSGYGNFGFSGVKNSASFIPTISAGTISATSVTAENINSGGGSSNDNGPWEYFTIAAFAPTSFATLAAGGNITLLNAPNLAPATSIDDDSVVKIPANAEIISLEADAFGTPPSPGGTMICYISDVANGLNSGTLTDQLWLDTTTTPLTNGFVLGRPNNSIANNANILGTIGGMTTNNTNYGTATASAETTIVYRNSSGSPYTAGNLRVSITYRTPRNYS